MLSRFKINSINHIKLLQESPEHEFLIIETVDPSNKPYLFLLERRSSESRVVDSEPTTYMDKLLEKIKKIKTTLTSFVNPPHLVEEGFGSSPCSLSMALETLSIGDKASLCLIQSSNLMSDSLDKSENSRVAIDRFLGQNHVFSSRYHGKVIGYLKPKHLTLFELVILSHVVHELYPYYSLLSNQCFFYARLIYATIEHHFGISPSISADEKKDVVYNIDSHLSIHYGRWKGIKVNAIDEETVSKVINVYKAAYNKQIAKVFFVYLFMMIQIHMTIDTDHKIIKFERASGEIGTYWKYSQRGIAVFKLVFVFIIFTHPQ